MPQWYEKQVGPLPLGIWVGVIAVGAGASYFVNRKKTTAAASASAAGGGDAGATDGAFGSLPGGVGVGGVIGLPGGVPAGQVPAGGTGAGIPITDNVSWLRQAEDDLIARGNDPGLVDTALRDYLNGQVPTAAEQAIVNLALEDLGPPPFPVVTIGPSPTPIPTPTPTPVRTPTPTPTPVSSGGGGGGGGYTPPPAPAVHYLPAYPASGSYPIPAGGQCPPSSPILIQGATGYTCATQAQYTALHQYLGY